MASIEIFDSVIRHEVETEEYKYAAFRHLDDAQAYARKLSKRYDGIAVSLVSVSESSGHVFETATYRSGRKESGQ